MRGGISVSVHLATSSAPGSFVGLPHCPRVDRIVHEADLSLWPSASHQPCFLSQLGVNIRQVLPKPFVALPAQQGVLPVVRPSSLQGANLLSSGSFFFHPRVLLLEESSRVHDFRMPPTGMANRGTKWGIVCGDFCRVHTGVARHTLAWSQEHLTVAYRGFAISMPKSSQLIEARARYCGRQGIFSLRIRYARVVRFIPSRAAAPFGPPMTQLDSRMARRTCSRSASSSVLSFELGACTVACFSSASGGRRAVPGDKITARSMKFCNSRTLPGHG